MIIAAIIHHRFWIGCVILVLVGRKKKSKMKAKICVVSNKRRARGG